MVRRAVGLITVFAAAAVAAACEPVAPLRGAIEEPVVMVVLSRGPSIDPDLPPDSTLHALVAATVELGTARYGSVSQFTMRRRSDQAQFDWVVTPRTGPLDVSYSWSLDRAEWNVHLAWNGTGGRLGRSDLQGGETYDLEIMTEGRRVIGAVTLPPDPVPVLETVGRQHTLSWDSVPGASFYVAMFVSNWVVSYPTGRTFSWSEPLDTLEQPRPVGWLRLRAYEPNLHRYMRDQTLPRSGISGAYGVFGAFSIDSVWVEPYQPPPLRALLRDR